MTTYNRTLYKIFCVSALTLLHSCGPVGLGTKTKKVPREYSVNYNHPNVKADKTELNSKAWVVYSDREGNVTTMRPGGSLPFKELGYLEPFYVIGRKGDYYKLIKYDPGIMKNERLSKRKEAEFYGWIHKDLLVLFNNSLTEVRNDIKLKSLICITDCGLVLEADKSFEEDAVKLYTSPKLENSNETIALNSMVYVLKTTDDGSRTLISTKMELAPEDMEATSLGWVDCALVAPFGQRMALNASPEIVAVAGELSDIHTTRKPLSPVSLNPVLFKQRTDTTLIFWTLDSFAILDHSDNRIYNVDGNPIAYDKAMEICNNLKDINVIFAFIPAVNVSDQLPMLLNAVQNLKPVFESQPEAFRFGYAAVVGSHQIGFSGDYLSFSDKLFEAGKGIASMPNGDFAAVIRNALSLSTQKPDATNLIILVGEKAPGWRTIPDDIKADIIRSNARLLSYQVFADNDDAYNNFVLQSHELIEYYAEQYRTIKREITIYSDQLRDRNLFREVSRNAYFLDFPQRSMSQGMVIFPEKGRSTEPEQFIAGVDSMVNQIITDNSRLIASIDRGFMQVGRHRSRFHNAVTDHLDIDPQTRTAPHIGNAFTGVSPTWIQVTERISIPLDSVNLSTVGLLLTEKELEDIKVWLENLTSMKPELKDKARVSSGKKKARPVKRVRRDLRGVDADIQDNYDAGEIDEEFSDTVKLKYVRTGPIRKNLVKTYSKSLEKCVFEGKPQRLTLARAQEYFTTMPTISTGLENMRIKDLKKKKRLGDEQLALLIEYFEEHYGLIESNTVSVDDLTVPGGEKFFFVPSEVMP